jgi:hypothetical protein
MLLDDHAHLAPILRAPQALRLNNRLALGDIQSGVYVASSGLYERLAA